MRVTQILNAGFQFDQDYIDSSQEKIETEYYLDKHDWMLWDFISIEITYVTVLKKNMYAHNTKILFKVNYWAHLVLDGLDDLVVGGEDDGDRDNEPECVDVGHVGDVVHRVPTGTIPFHSTTEISKKIKLNTFWRSVYPLKFLWAEKIRDISWTNSQ